MFAVVAKHVKDQIGMDIVECDFFNGVRQNSKGKYFNIILNNDQEYYNVVRLATYSSMIKSIEPNGVNRFAIFIN